MKIISYLCDVKPKTALPMKRFFLFFVLLWIFVSCGKSDNQQDNRLYDNWKYIGYRDKALKIPHTLFVCSRLQVVLYCLF